MNILVGCDIPIGATFSVDLEHAFNIEISQSKFTKKIFENIMEISCENDVLFMQDYEVEEWLTWIPLAEDIHSENATLNFQVKKDLPSFNEPIERQFNYNSTFDSVNPKLLCDTNFLNSQRNGTISENTEGIISNNSTTNLKFPHNLKIKPQNKSLSEDEGKLIFTLTRNVKKGDSIAFWFSRELAAILQIPFLNFTHILDGKYQCQKCRKTYSSPNPLKIHLASDCGVLNSQEIWLRFFNHLNNTKIEPSIQRSNERRFFNHFNNTKTNPFIEELNKRKTKNLDDLMMNGYCDKKLKTPIKSAFKPVKQMKSFPNYLRSEKTLNTFLNPLPISENFKYLPLLSDSLLFHEHPAFRGLPWPAIRPYPQLNRLTHPFAIDTTKIEPDLLKNLPVFPSTSHNLILENMSGGVHKGKHICPYCSKAYSRKYGLKIHIRTHTGYKPLKCKVCLRPFGDPSNLNKHVRLHAQGETPYKCSICSKILVRKRDLERHLRSRHSAIKSTEETVTSTIQKTDVYKKFV